MISFPMSTRKRHARTNKANPRWGGSSFKRGRESQYKEYESDPMTRTASQRVNLWSPMGLLEVKTRDKALLIKHMGWEESREISSERNDDNWPDKYRRVGSPEIVRYFVGVAVREKWGAYLSESLFIAPDFLGKKGVPFFEDCEEWKIKKLKEVTLKLLTSSENWYKSRKGTQEEEAKLWVEKFRKFLTR
jgi:hypothetical protein